MAPRVLVIGSRLRGLDSTSSATQTRRRLTEGTTRDRLTRFATTALMSAGLGLVAVGFGAGVANAQPYERCHGCPGDGPVARRKWRADCGIGIRAVPQCHSKNPPSAPSESRILHVHRGRRPRKPRANSLADDSLTPSARPLRGMWQADLRGVGWAVQHRTVHPMPINGMAGSAAPAR